MNPTKLIGLLMDTTNNRQIEVGKIDIMKGFSFFEVEKQHEDLVFRSFSRDIRHEGAKVKVEISEGKPGNAKRGAAIKDWKESEALDSYTGYKKKDSYKSGSKKKSGAKKKHRKGVSRK